MRISKKFIVSFLRSGTLLCILTMLVFVSCDKRILEEPGATVTDDKSSQRLSSVAVFESSYEMETFSATQVISQGSKKAGPEDVFRQISAQPKLERKAYDFKIYQDGRFEMTTIQMEPQNKSLLPAALAGRQKESVGSFKTVVSNGVARFYNKDGQENGSYKLKTDRLESLAAMIKTSKAKGTELGNQIAGHPLIERESILSNARAHNAEIFEGKGITRIKTDLAVGSKGVDPSSQGWQDKYLVQDFDFEKKRLLSDAVYVKGIDEPVMRTSFQYSDVSKGNNIEKIVSEQLEIDAQTGRKIKHLKNVFYSKVKINTNL